MADTVLTNLKVTGNLTVNGDETVTGDLKKGANKYLPILILAAAPTTATAGVVGQFAIYPTTPALYICTAAAETYTWNTVTIT